MTTVEWLLDSDPSLRWQVMRDLLGEPAEVVEAERARVAADGCGAELLSPRSTGKVLDPRFTLFSFPTWWYYDVLRGLEYFRSTGAAFDERCAEAIDLVADKADGEGRWPIENVHQGPTHIEIQGPEGFPSRWNTLRARRVLAFSERGVRLR